VVGARHHDIEFVDKSEVDIDRSLAAKTIELTKTKVNESFKKE
jgi:hypothetical protein